MGLHKSVDHQNLLVDLLVNLLANSIVK